VRQAEPWQRPREHTTEHLCHRRSIQLRPERLSVSHLRGFDEPQESQLMDWEGLWIDLGGEG